MNRRKSSNCSLLFYKSAWSTFCWWPDWMSSVAILILILFMKFPGTNGEHLLHKMKGSVGAANFTYHHLKWPGRIRVLLNPVKGDADLYVSDKTSKPNFDNFELDSATCGKESLDIPARFRRPVNIGVFGYPLTERSHYELIFIHLADKDDIDEYDAIAFSAHNIASKSASYSNGYNLNDYKSPARPVGDYFDDSGDDEESIIWTLFIYILKFIFDILL